MGNLVIGEYEIIEDLQNGVFKCLRNGEEWRDLVGDNLILSLVELIRDLAEENESMSEDVNFLSCLDACGVDNWSGYSEAWQMMREEEDNE